MWEREKERQRQKEREKNEEEIQTERGTKIPEKSDALHLKYIIFSFCSELTLDYNAVPTQIRVQVNGKDSNRVPHLLHCK